MRFQREITAAVLIPAWRDQRAITVTAARRTLGRPRQVWWMRYGVDLWLLLGSADQLFFEQIVEAAMADLSETAHTAEGSVR